MVKGCFSEDEDVFYRTPSVSCTLSPGIVIMHASLQYIMDCIYIRSLESVHRLRYFRFCNVLHIWTIRAIPTYRVYRLYDSIN